MTSDVQVMIPVDEVFSHVVKWAAEKGILEKATPATQMLKMTEEVGELAKAIRNGDMKEVEDSIGDCMVVLTILAAMYQRDARNCYEGSWKVIRGRTGQMVNGVFIKQEDLDKLEAPNE